MSYKCNEIAKADRVVDPEPTVGDLVKLRANINSDSIDFVSGAIVKRFYKEWIEHINSLYDLRYDEKDGLTGKAVYEFMFFVHLGENRNYMLDCWSHALDIILAAHPNLRFYANADSDKISVHVCYGDCLEDKIEYDASQDNTLIKDWKEQQWKKRMGLL
jgi:hypothetical protein